ncbi:hypothetical protein FACS1894208_06000 [Clostridia bacterium]|nr:hypothetical protein FACS1894208_06000 [Clostridia bacterium]
MRGIDAANSEIGCRPEVMATGFRYLAAFEPRIGIENPFADNIPPVIIHRTFHVGEDFLDLTDGLRAIHEACLFLGLSDNDRIGHGIRVMMMSGS